MNKTRKKSKVLPIALIVIIVLAILYVGMSIFFINRFHFGSVINGVNYSGKTVEQVETDMKKQIDDYNLLLIQREDQNEVISAKDINLQFVSDGKVAALKDEQNAFAWLISSFKTETHEMQATVTYDKKLLTEKINNLEGLDPDNVTEPENAYANYTDKAYEIVPEVQGNKINKKSLSKLIAGAIVNGDESIVLEDEKCYIKPKVTAKNKKLKATVETLNLYVGTVVNYDFSDRTEVLDGSIIKDWLVVDDNMNVVIDENQLREYVKTLEVSYNTLGKPRSFVTTELKKTVKEGVDKGKEKVAAESQTIQVPSGNYGWMISRGREMEALTALVKEGKTVTREPEYALTAVSRNVDDVGDTYVEINLKEQYMWFYKDGKLLVKTEIVTGNISRGYDTPPGVFGITYKERDATLNGENYSSPVNYWLPFNGNIGIHDATWRNEFGGEIYKSSGSHGCVNTPYKNAKIIFDNIEKGTPVICY